ncbi:hypothetical protein HMI54_013549, partial [Coelomomyces lativittatus]
PGNALEHCAALDKWEADAAYVAHSSNSPTLQEALSGPNCAQWLAAMAEEYQALLAHQTFQEDECPKNANIIL